MQHITIYHETYHVPVRLIPSAAMHSILILLQAGNWESIHVNNHISGLGSTVFKIVEEGTGKDVYTHPIVDASKGVLKTSAGRMARSAGKDHEGKLDVDPYDI